jgi:hypothetical protein
MCPGERPGWSARTRHIPGLFRHALPLEDVTSIEPLVVARHWRMFVSPHEEESDGGPVGSKPADPSPWGENPDAFPCR